MSASPAPLTIALPKGRLQEQVLELLLARGIDIRFRERELVARDPESRITCFLVKNSDLPTYVNHGIAGLGVCGTDVIYESGYSFYRLHAFPFGKTRMCLAGRRGEAPGREPKKLTIATKFTRYTRDYFTSRGVPVQIIRLNGSVELAPVLGLAPCIVDLVETGSTLKAHSLEIFQVLEEMEVYLIANPGYYKIHYQRIRNFIDLLKGDDEKDGSCRC